MQNFTIYTPLASKLPPELILIESHSILGLPQIDIVGLPSKEISESKTRIRSAFSTQNLKLLDRRWTINLAPSHLPKTGTHADLGIALSFLAQAYDLNWLHGKRVIASAELGLDGNIRSSKQACLALECAILHQVDLLILSIEDKETLLKFIEFYPNCNLPRLYIISNLKDLLQPIEFIIPTKIKINNESIQSKSLLPISGELLRLITCSIVGRHHMILLGPKGVGKSSLLDWISTLNPPPTIEKLRFNFLLNEMSKTPNSTSDPWIRKIHPGISLASLRGRISYGQQMPGEIAKSDGGLLIADEFPELSRDIKESLRIPLETKQITVQQASGTYTLPADFLLIATGNLCPCGKLDLDRSGSCKCNITQRRQYLQRLSGPIIDRIDMVLGVKHTAPQTDVSFQEVISRVNQYRNISIARWSKPAGNLNGSELEDILQQNIEIKTKLDQWTKNIQSLRSKHKILRLALTLSVMDSEQTPTDRHFFESLQLRPESNFDHLLET